MSKLHLMFFFYTNNPVIYETIVDFISIKGPTTTLKHTVTFFKKNLETYG